MTKFWTPSFKTQYSWHSFHIIINFILLTLSFYMTLASKFYIVLNLQFIKMLSASTLKLCCTFYLIKVLLCLTLWFSQYSLFYSYLLLNNWVFIVQSDFFEKLLVSYLYWRRALFNFFILEFFRKSWFQEWLWRFLSWSSDMFFWILIVKG